MPQIFKIGGFVIYFWSNEGDPLEPVHVHVTDGVPSPHATKIWLTRSGHCLLCHNKSNIHKSKLSHIMKIIEARHQTVFDKWISHFGSITYYC